MSQPRPVSRVRTPMLALLLAGAATLAPAADRGLALAIGQPRHQAALPGVAQDGAHAAALYSRLGFEGAPARPDAKALALPGLRAALARLVDDTAAGDRVFLYFSGYGTARRDAARGCVPTWLAADGRALPPAELDRTVQALAARASQLVVVVDASAAAVQARTPRGAKSARGAGAGACAAPGPWLAGAPVAGENGIAALEGRTVLIAAAGRVEHALDDPARGGVATQALLACLARPAFARNPLAAFEDLHDCTRGELAAAGQMQRPVLYGHAGLPVQPQLAAVVPPSADVGRESPVAALHRAAAQADARWGVRAVATARPAGAVSVTSDRDGFLYIVRAGTDAADLNLVYPPRGGEPQPLRAGQGVEVPRPTSETGTAPSDQLMVLVSDRPLRPGDLLVGLGLAPYAAAACLRNLGGEDCPSPAAGAPEGTPALTFGATLMSADGAPVVIR